MPTDLEVKNAIQWALSQKDASNNPITEDMHHELVDKVREYFNTNSLAYVTFSCEDLKPWLK